MKRIVTLTMNPAMDLTAEVACAPGPSEIAIPRAFTAFERGSEDMGQDGRDGTRVTHPTGWRVRFWKAANAAMLLAFGFSVIVQANDPDPALWMLVYGLAAAACALALAGRGHWAFPAAVALAAGAWAAGIAPRVVGRVPFLDMFGAFEMESLEVEEAREMYGLLIVAAWMAVLAWRGARREGAAPEGDLLEGASGGRAGRAVRGGG